MANSVDDELGRYVKWFEQFCHEGRDMLTEAARARDYRDGKQLTASQIEALNDRSQPPVVYNRIKRKIDYLVGVEKQQRTDPKAYPRTPQHQQDAHAATDALRYQAEVDDYDVLRSRAWIDILSVGWGGVQKTLRRNPRTGDVEHSTASCAWDRMWWDIHSSELNFSDAEYRGMVRWMDFDKAVAEYGEKHKEALEAARTEAIELEHRTFNDKPDNNNWYDRAGDRVRICQVYCQKSDGWCFAEFTRGALLVEATPSPFVDDDGMPMHPYNWQSAYVDGENHRYGIIRELFDPQDEVNKRRSKLLHHLNSNRTFAREGAVGDHVKFKKEMAKPNGHVKLTEASEWGRDVGLVPEDGDVSGHASLLQEAKNEIDLLGPNAALQGKADGVQSGRAIQAQQQGGLIELGGLMDALRQMDKENYRTDWLLIRKFWTAPKWIRITDDERNVRFVGFNQPYQDPQTGEVKLIQPAQMDVDIIIEDAPDLVTLEGEAFESLVGLAQVGVVLPPQAYVEAAPNLRNKDKIVEMLEQGQMQAQQAQQPNPLDMIEAERKSIETAAKAEKMNAETTKIKVETAEQLTANTVY